MSLIERDDEDDPPPVRPPSGVVRRYVDEGTALEWRQERDEVREQLQGAVKALREYGTHKATCARLGASDTRSCDCGLRDAFNRFRGQ